MGRFVPDRGGQHVVSNQETEADQPQDQDMVDLLEDQHQQVRRLFTELESLSGDAAREPFDSC